MKISPTVRASQELLGVEGTAGPSELKRAYHRLALLYHPDRNPSPEAAVEFQKVTEAYELLCDPLRVSELNRRYLRERLHRPVVEGLQITFGSFFGYRIFDPTRTPHGKSAARAKLHLAGGSDPAGATSNHERSPSPEDDAMAWLPVEENNSILDNSAYDALEVVYAGRLSAQDEEQLKDGMDSGRLVRLPWVVLNNQGLLRFLDGDIKGARKCYHELCERIPNNIIFLYRLGICHILEGFQKPRRTLLGSMKPDRIKIEKGIDLLRHCLKLGEERPVGRQKCLVIRKTLADVLEKTGRAREARKIWRDIFKEDPSCAEAALHVKGPEESARLVRRKNTRIQDSLGPSRIALNPSQSKNFRDRS